VALQIAVSYALICYSVLSSEWTIGDGLHPASPGIAYIHPCFYICLIIFLISCSGRSC